MSGNDASRLAELLTKLGWSAGVLAKRLGITDRSGRDWVSGRRPVPPEVVEWLEERAKWADKGPALPKGWQPP
jgi:hypothetical protein